MKILIQKAARAAKRRNRRRRTDRSATWLVLEAETARLERSIQTFLDFARPPTLEKRSGDVCQVLGKHWNWSVPAPTAARANRLRFGRGRW